MRLPMIAVVAAAAVVACGEDAVSRGDVLVHVDGEVRHTMTVCCDGSDKLGARMVVSNPTERTLDLEIVPESSTRPALKINPARMVLAPNAERTVRMELNDIPNFFGGGDTVLIV